ncbi:haloacid dehalogenase-like hydrolase [Streptosporangium sp. NPDC051022]|uniref:HAD family hydrolase n=1 Tax=Streptosporangium sp. NPDC051022 TaxID=3155752 RepID=UPI00342C5851
MDDSSPLPSGEPPGVAVFDLDDTLVRGECGEWFLRWLMRRQPWRLALLLPALPVIASLRALPSTRTRKAALSGLCWFATVGRDDEELDRLARAFAAGHAGPGSANPMRAGLARLREHLARGDRVVIASGSGLRIVRAVCVELGLHDVEIVATRERRMLGGLVVDERCLGGGKVLMLRAAGTATPFGYAYSDSASDLPLLLAARRRFAISPSASHLRRILAGTDGDCTVLPWRTEPSGPASHPAAAPTPTSCPASCPASGPAAAPTPAAGPAAQPPSSRSPSDLR